MFRLASNTALAAIMATAVAALAENPHHPCSAKTIEGDYAFRISGELFTPAGTVSRDGIALTGFR